MRGLIGKSCARFCQYRNDHRRPRRLDRSLTLRFYPRKNLTVAVKLAGYRVREGHFSWPWGLDKRKQPTADEATPGHGLDAAIIDSSKRIADGAHGCIRAGLETPKCTEPPRSAVCHANNRTAMQLETEKYPRIDGLAVSKNRLALAIGPELQPSRAGVNGWRGNPIRASEYVTIVLVRLALHCAR
jgi:hypothetical protein